MKEKPEAKTVLEIAGIEGASNPNELKQAICDTHCIGRCPENTCSKITQRWVSEAKFKRLQTETNKRDLTCSREIYWEQEAKIKGLQTENEQLKAVRDALGQSSKNALADRNRYIKKAEELEGRLSAIKQYADRLNASHSLGNHLVAEELGVLLNSEASDVQASRKEIRQGKSKKSKNVNEFLRELKGEEKK